MDQETLYDLRRLVAVYPTYHAARILFLQNLFLLHDPTFDQELRRAALLVPDRRVLFAMTQTISQPKTATTASMVEAPAPAEEKPHMATEDAVVQDTSSTPAPTAPRNKKNAKKYAVSDTTLELLDNFLDTTQRPLTKKRIKADPSTDYMSYLLQQEDDDVRNAAEAASNVGQSRLDSLIDTFIATTETGITLPDDPMIPDGILDETDTAETANDETATAQTNTAEMSKAETATAEMANAETATAGAASVLITASTEHLTPASTTDKRETSTESETANNDEEEHPAKQIVTSSAELSETLAQIYIKQHRYDRAIEVLSKINAEDTANTNPYLADQMRFLQKLAKLNNGGKSK